MPTWLDEVFAGEQGLSVEFSACTVHRGGPDPASHVSYYYYGETVLWHIKGKGGDGAEERLTGQPFAVFLRVSGELERQVSADDFSPILVVKIGHIYNLEMGATRRSVNADAREDDVLTGYVDDWTLELRRVRRSARHKPVECLEAV